MSQIDEAFDLLVHDPRIIEACKTYPEKYGWPRHGMVAVAVHRDAEGPRVLLGMTDDVATELGADPNAEWITAINVLDRLETMVPGALIGPLREAELAAAGTTTPSLICLVIDESTNARIDVVKLPKENSTR